MAGESDRHFGRESACPVAATEPRPDGRGEHRDRTTMSACPYAPQRSPGLMAGERAPVGTLWGDWHPGCDFERLATTRAIWAASVVKDQMGSSHGLAFERCRS